VSLNRWVFKCQQVESFRWMEQQQKKRDGPVRCVCEERRASEERRSRGGARVCASSLRYVEVAVVCTV